MDKQGLAAHGLCAFQEESVDPFAEVAASILREPSPRIRVMDQCPRNVWDPGQMMIDPAAMAINHCLMPESLPKSKESIVTDARTPAVNTIRLAFCLPRRDRFRHNI